MIKVGIIGGGPAGIIAALEVAKIGGEIILFDLNPRLGKKLSVTGSGRCNITNLNAAPKFYTSSSQEVLQSIFQVTQPINFIEYLRNLGILTYHSSDGWVYPVSNSASNVVDIFLEHLKNRKVDIHVNEKIHTISSGENGFVLTSSTGKMYAVNKVIIASGGKAHEELGANDDILNSVALLGHRLIPFRPALAPVLLQQPINKGLKGVRLDVNASLYKNEQIIAQTSGNIIFTEWGINGPAVMDLSHLIQEPKLTRYKLQLDFLHNFTGDFKNCFSRASCKEMHVVTLLKSMLPEKLILFMFNKYPALLDARIGNLFQSQIEFLLENLTAFELRVSGTRDFNFSQLSAGGINLKDINEYSLESKIIPGLFFAGEALDVNGPCGGFNLQWAFGSGFAAGSAVLGKYLP